MTSHLQLTLLRHGRSRADDENVHEGRYDSPLTEAGRTQAQKLAAYWQANLPQFEAAICSSLSRAHETAQIVCRPLGLTPQVSHLWREWDNGPLAGMKHEEAEQRYPMPAFRHDLSPFTADGGESQAQIRARALTALHELWAMPLSNILIVSHGGFLNSVLRELIGSNHAWFEFGDTGFARLRLSRESHTVRVLSVNEQPHIAH
ncbi:histidine phosphatase family protein [Deinococcus psychrotolerans]|uniref:Histidine phosphatase family protein n=1 Tax=Deinococcus psychrotolerans TaxID=2489213 RepID=A0A3G8YKG7_9DEIO|nr:histidine phosphatase family protein [Deinococcus psychrotolerans]AZI41556.1 histidine phosphatase family protein [Deinococcus psychrotolerans]